MKEITISELNQGQRADKFVRKYLNDAPLSFIYKLFRIKDVKVNDKRIPASYILQCGDRMKIYVTDAQLEDFAKPVIRPEVSASLTVLYEDENLLLVNKPSGLLVHGDSREKRRTLSNMVLNYLYSKQEYAPTNPGFVPSPCHRLDRNTSGLVVFAKNFEALKEMEELFKVKEELKKEYLVLVAGRVTGSGSIDAPLYKDEQAKKVSVRPESRGGKAALTKYESLEVFHDCSLLRAQIITGRTHQIRVHFSSVHHPVIGDAKYGNFSINKRFEDRFAYSHQFLHAWKIAFGTVTGKLSYLSNCRFTCPLPERENGILNQLKEHPDDQLF